MSQTSPPDPMPILAGFGLHNAASAVPVPGGADTAIWRVELGGAIYALRLFRPDQVRAVQRETAAMAAAHACGLPVPAIHAQGIWRNRPALLINWLPGDPIRDVLTADPRQAWALGDAFGRSQAEIHRCPVPDELQADRHAWIALAEPDKRLTTILVQASRERAALLHLDYHPMNVLVTAGRVSAILDWTNARAGDPRADLARTCSILHFAPLLTAPSDAADEHIRREVVAGWRHGYHAVAGRVDGMAPFLAWAGAFMMRDLAPRLGRPDLPWITGELLARVRAWTAAWRARAGESV